ncbi:DUF3284 domain-containing protein [Clostridium sp. AL.422]|uniref:DUF3284 domain-containing protein n=1 Tax=Clostridium TaxID=1485 RepID=UPI00293DDE25|nr:MULTISPECIES: DUF3284 domain-containing protein [unclassified Clostridium]MDV4152309.1 DUF3284 domain-containing protein [Clostridium sp. AL.422]
MKQYNINTIVNYPLERVFKVFIDLNKREIPKFNDKNPVGCSNKRALKYVGKQKIEMVTTVTGYEKNKLYEVTNSINEDNYISKYIFTKIDDKSTEISLSEGQVVKGFTSQITILIQRFSVKKKLKNKINNLKEVLGKELERRDGGIKNTQEIND